MTVVGATISFEVSLLERVTKTPSAGAGCLNTTATCNCCPGNKVRPEGRMISDKLTITLAVALVTFGAAVLAVIVAGDVPSSVTGTFTVLAPTGIVTVEGTVTEAGLFELRLTINPPDGASVDRFKWRVPVPGPERVTLGGVKLKAAPTCTA
jgi:hypothetical protein